MSSTVPPLPGPLYHPGRPEGAVEGEVEVEAGDAAGCPPEEEVAGATTMEARPGVAAAAVEGAVVAVAVGVAAAPPVDDERA